MNITKYFIHNRLNEQSNRHSMLSHQWHHWKWEILRITDKLDGFLVYSGFRHVIIANLIKPFLYPFIINGITIAPFMVFHPGEWIGNGNTRKRIWLFHQKYQEFATYAKTWSLSYHSVSVMLSPSMSMPILLLLAKMVQHIQTNLQPWYPDISVSN